MLYDVYLIFLQNFCKKARIGAIVTSADRLMQSIRDRGLEAAIGQTLDEAPHRTLVGGLSHRTLYKSSDAFGLRYMYLLLPDSASVLLIGPYVAEIPSDEWMISISEALGVPHAKHKYVREFFSSLPVMPDGCATMHVVSTFCEQIWEDSSFSIVDVSAPDMPISAAKMDLESAKSHEEALIDIKMLERRYEFENEMIKAVTLGQIHKDSEILHAFSADAFESRTQDSVRNAKNYSIIMNTLLRKAAENGGVHPINIDRLSSEFAYRIENLTRATDAAALMADMFRSYCRLVRAHSTSAYSPAVQRAVLVIDSDLSADLSLHSLADALKLSEGYLCAIFKKETGKTVTEYIRERRMKHACHLLASTGLQVQSIALACGIMDVQYFSKLFKKHTGKTPKEYRESASK